MPTSTCLPTGRGRNRSVFKAITATVDNSIAKLIWMKKH